MFNERSTAMSSRILAKFSSVTMIPSTSMMNVFSRNCGMYWRIPRRSVSFKLTPGLYGLGRHWNPQKFYFNPNAERTEGINFRAVLGVRDLRNSSPNGRGMGEGTTNKNCYLRNTSPDPLPLGEEFLKSRTAVTVSSLGSECQVQ